MKTFRVIVACVNEQCSSLNTEQKGDKVNELLTDLLTVDDLVPWS